jgi:GNAT superfamily N-acetyltransferase
MIAIKTKKVQCDLSDSSFNCGVAGINRMIRESYYPTLLQHMYAYEIIVNDIIVGYYMIEFRRIYLAESGLEEKIGEYISDLADACYALNLRYIAVGSEYQHRGIGSLMLKLIIKQTNELCKNWPIRLITLDALPEKVEWYKSNGFLPFRKNCAKNAKGEVPMFFDCLLDEKLLEEYCLRKNDI